jgi:xanthine dehydrogenase YagR molybdenum-binding subunit
MEDYRIPGIADVPRLHVRADLARDRQCDLQCVHFDEAGFDHLLGGSVGVGEVATAIGADARLADA